MLTTYDEYTTVPSQWHYCGHCGLWHDGPCPRIRAIEYYPNGGLKRVEYRGDEPSGVFIKKYTVIDGELFEVVNGMPPGAVPFSGDSGFLKLGEEE